MSGHREAHPPSREQQIESYMTLWDGRRGEAERVVDLQARVQALEQEIQQRDEREKALRGQWDAAISGAEPLLASAYAHAYNAGREAAEARVKELEAERDEARATRNMHKERREKAEQQATALRAALDHAHWCRECAKGPWANCDEGRKGEALLAQANPPKEDSRG